MGFSKVSEMRLELTRSNDHYPLKVARLPIPPSGHYAVKSLKSSKAWSEKRDSNPRPRPWQGRALPTELFSRMRISVIHCQYFIVLSLGAKNGTRTRDPDLGKVVLYQLSYFRVGQPLFFVCDAKVGIFSELTKYRAKKFAIFLAQNCR